jgi:hypothetical protein
MSLYEDTQEMIEIIIASYKEANKDGSLTFKEAMTLVYNASATFVRFIENFKASGDLKKETVKLAIAKFYDEVIAPIDIQGIPNFLEGIVDEALKNFILILVDMWIDSLVNIFNKIGWGNDIGSQDAAELTALTIF